jgi:hypothetical protein
MKKKCKTARTFANSICKVGSARIAKQTNDRKRETINNQTDSSINFTMLEGEINSEHQLSTQTPEVHKVAKSVAKAAGVHTVNGYPICIEDPS